MNALKWKESVITIVSMFGGHISVLVGQDLPLLGITGMWKVCSNSVYFNVSSYFILPILLLEVSVPKSSN